MREHNSDDQSGSWCARVGAGAVIGKSCQLGLTSSHMRSCPCNTELRILDKIKQQAAAEVVPKLFLVQVRFRFILVKICTCLLLNIIKSQIIISKVESS